MSVFKSLKQLVTNFNRDIGIEKALDSPNVEDDIVIKAAMVGFSYNSPIQEWAKNHFDFTKSRINRYFQEEANSDYGENSENVKLFSALALGFLLGLYQQGHIREAEFDVAEVQIPGLIMLHLSRITTQPLSELEDPIS